MPRLCRVAPTKAPPEFSADELAAIGELAFLHGCIKVATEKEVSVRGICSFIETRIASICAGAKLHPISPFGVLTLLVESGEVVIADGKLARKAGGKHADPA